MEKKYQLALTLTKGIGPTTGRQLFEYFGNAQAIFEASKKELLSINGFPATLADAIRRKTPLIRAEKEMEFINDNNIQLIFWNDRQYPKRLKHCNDAPLILYYKGTADLNSQKIISMVGTRNATNYGRSVCKDLLAELKQYNPLIISGLAYGIDSYSHQGALNNDLETVGVLGHGLDRIYPQSHVRLAEKMLKQGGLLTEFTSQTRPERQNFPMRNRIIAGIADVTIVVEAPEKGGALITANIANTYNRDVCAVPGNIYQEFSAGCNLLIKTNKAFPITNAADLAYLMSWEPDESTLFTERPQPTSEEERYIFDLLRDNGPQNIGVIADNSGLEHGRLSLILLEMEIKGLLVKLPGNIYTIKGEM